MRVLSLILNMLHEVFDESAYARFLKRTGMVNSRAAYAEFWREREIMRARAPRCC
jgi:hypothetical protein